MAGKSGKVGMPDDGLLEIMLLFPAEDLLDALI
jgi:hypothetical protein